MKSSSDSPEPAFRRFSPRCHDQLHMQVDVLSLTHEQETVIDAQALKGPTIIIIFCSV